MENDYLSNLLGQIKNPEMKNVLQMMIEQQKQKAKNASRFPAITKEKAINDVKQCLEKIKGLREDVIQLNGRLHEMLDLQATIASALGACNCYGLNPFCDNCYGSGKPGTKPLNEEAFNTFVYPLIQKLSENIPEDPLKEFRIENPQNKNQPPPANS
ncbi:MAG: hypothetical protein IPJ79_05570 [Bacteroidetes bacterium]|nr:hypothetical protein [Bacteroidota bacterium]